MLNDYITANVQFLDGTNHNMQYSYALYDPTICVSDIVVVKTGHHGFALAKVIEIAPESATAVQFGREIVSKVDFSAYTARQEKAKQLKELFEIGDEIHDELKTGEPITLVVVEKDKPFDGDVMFMLKDCLRDTYPMNDDYTNAGGWKTSKLRKVLNTEILALLPDDMRAAIKPRVIDGESDLLWLASEMEVFGLHDWTENDPDRGEQMAYYKRRGNRIKALSDEGEAAYGWWERSPFACYTTFFCFVDSAGGANGGSASNSFGVAFGFCV